MKPQSRSAITISVVVGVSEVHITPQCSFPLLKCPSCVRGQGNCPFLNSWSLFAVCCQVGNPPLDELCKVCAQEVPLFLSPAWPLLPSFLSGWIQSFRVISLCCLPVLLQCRCLSTVEPICPISQAPLRMRGCVAEPYVPLYACAVLLLSPPVLPNPAVSDRVSWH